MSNSHDEETVRMAIQLITASIKDIIEIQLRMEQKMLALIETCDHTNVRSASLVKRVSDPIFKFVGARRNIKDQIPFKKKVTLWSKDNENTDIKARGLKS
jgi:hypothetical protein